MPVKSNKEDFVRKSNIKHNYFFGYNNVIYVDSSTKVFVTCPIHGDFPVTPNNHLRGNGCPFCRTKYQNDDKRDTLKTFIEKAEKKFPNVFSFEKSAYVNSRTKIIITCPIHGDFTVRPNDFLKSKFGCKKCGLKHTAECKQYDREEYIRRCKLNHTGIDYSNITFTKETKLSEIGIFNCEIHGDFSQEWGSHLKGSSCPKCAHDKLKLSQEEYIAICQKKHNNKYDYSPTIYKGSCELIKINCPVNNHGEFEQMAYIHASGHGCYKCANNSSKGEEEILEYVKSMLPENTLILTRNRSILKPLELDIYIPEKKLAIEYNGLYWHSEAYRETNFHQTKTNTAEINGIQLIHVMEDEWICKPEIVISRLRSILGCSTKKIYARKTTVVEIDIEQARMFLTKNHIQGFYHGLIYLGLIENDTKELVSVMSFGNMRVNLGSKPEKDKYELLRFANTLNTNVIGGASKLLKHFISKYKPLHITSYCDRRWSLGNLYKTLGFELTKTTQPNYFYIINGERKNRFSYRKDNLVSKYGCPKEKTEQEFCFEQGWLRIYDSGQYKFEMNLPIINNQ